MSVSWRTVQPGDACRLMVALDIAAPVESMTRETSWSLGITCPVNTVPASITSRMWSTPGSCGPDDVPPPQAARKNSPRATLWRIRASPVRDGEVYNNAISSTLFRSVIRRLTTRLPRPGAQDARPQREAPLQGDLERHDDPAAGARDRAEPAVHGVAERSGRRVETAHVQQHGVRRRGVSPAEAVGRAVPPLVEPAEQVHRQQRHGEPAVGAEPGRVPVDLKVERRLPRARAGVAPGHPAQLALEAAPHP